MRLGRMPVGRRRRGKHTFPLFYEDADLEILENIPLKDLLKTLQINFKESCRPSYRQPYRQPYRQSYLESLKDILRVAV